MTAPSSPTPALVCEITAADAAQASTLTAIAKACAKDVAQRLVLRKSAPPKRRRGSRVPAEAVLTLRLPAALAAEQHPVWCLACRLACFCPDARVSVLVECAESFAPRPVRKSA